MANNDDINSAKAALLKAAQNAAEQSSAVKIEWTTQQRRDFRNRLRKTSKINATLKDALLKDL